MKMIPKEMRRLKQWTYSLNTEELKRPTHYKYPPNGALSLSLAQRKAGEHKHVGFYVTEEDPYILGDIDHIRDMATPFANLPMELVVFLQSNPTYMEVSPSGAGIRFIYRLPHASLKHTLSGNVYYALGMPEKRECQINFGPPWMTITGNALVGTVNTIGEVDIKELLKVFDIRKEEEQVVQTTVDPASISPLPEVQRALKKLPLDKNPRIRRAYREVFGHDYSHYDYWLKVLMALHNYATITGENVRCLEMAVRWSSTDPESFTGEDDVANKWRSFSKDQAIISYKTLFSLFNKTILRWPKPKKQSKEERNQGKPRKPINGETVNFKALMDYYDITVYRDVRETNVFYMTGDEDILDKYFRKIYRVEKHFDKYYGGYTEKTLTPSLQVFCQEHGFESIQPPAIRAHMAVLLAQAIHTFDPVRYYFDTPFDELPERYRENAEHWDKSTVETMFNTLSIEYDQSVNRKTQQQLYYMYYRAWLMGMVHGLYYPDSPHGNNCVLILMGAEQTRKTSHFKFMLPSFMKREIAFTTHGFNNDASIRDLSKIAASSLIVVWDEIDHYLSRDTESNFKKLIDNTRQSFIDKYEVQVTEIQPMAIYGGTTNLYEIDIGPMGSRRLFAIPVTWVDTDTINEICWHRLINDLRGEVDQCMLLNEVPWLLSDQMLELQRQLHHLKRKKDSVELRLEEMFEFDTPLNIPKEDGSLAFLGIKSVQRATERLMTTKQVRQSISAYDPDMNVADKALLRSLRSLCGAYTRTENSRIFVEQPKCMIEHGLVSQQSGTKTHKKWLMPPRRKY